MSDGNITLLYSMAMIVDALTALLVGKAYDHLKEKTGLKTGGLLLLIGIPIITILLPPLTISNSTTLIIIGMAAFGIVMGTHEAIMRSAIADITLLISVGLVMEYLTPVTDLLFSESCAYGLAL